MATFGNTSTTGADSTLGANNAYGSKGTPTVAGKLFSYSIYWKASVVKNTKFFLTLNSTKAVVSNSVTNACVPSSSSFTWDSFDLPSPISVTAGTLYFLNIITETAFSTDQTAVLDSLASNGWFDNTNSYITPQGTSSGSAQTYKFALYATYADVELTTTNVSGFSSSGAALNGTIDVIHDAQPTKRGFVYSTTSFPKYPGDVSPGSTNYVNFVEESGTFSTGAYSLNVAGLTNGGTYYFRAYAQTTNGYSYSGKEIRFQVPIPSAWIAA